MILNDLGLKYGTDKSTINHDYLNRVYGKYLERFRDEPIVLIEIGVGDGGSLKMWNDYFTRARVFGIDIDPQCAKSDTVFIGNQADERFLENVLSQTDQPTVVIDDGSHVAQEQIASFGYLMPRIKPGGLYFVEDTHTFYEKSVVRASTNPPKPMEAFNFFTGLAADIDMRGRMWSGDYERNLIDPDRPPPIPPFAQYISAIHIHQSIWVFERR